MLGFARNKNNLAIAIDAQPQQEYTARLHYLHIRILLLRTHECA